MNQEKKVKPLVSIICITYNQEKFIAKALDGFLIQQTNFPIEILVHDDCSTDGTQAILKEYASKNKDIRLVIENENKYSKRDFSFLENMFKKSKGKYIALCEGDDYWTDSKKLQKQVDYLEKDTTFSMCFHPVEVLYEDKSKSPYIFPEENSSSSFTLEKLLNRNFIQTNSVMYRRQTYKNIKLDIMPIDLYLHLYHAKYGKIGFLNDVMGVYRKHPDGIWWETSNNPDKYWIENWEAQVKFYQKILRLFDKNIKFKKIIYSNISNVFNNLAEIDLKKNTKLLTAAVAEYPDYAVIKITSDLALKSELGALVKENKKLLKLINKQEVELNTVKSSKLWKLKGVLLNMMGRK